MFLFIPGQAQIFTFREVATGLRIPWEIKWGPDNQLWCTERAGVVNRIDPETGNRQVILDHRGWVVESEGGLCGLCFHPSYPDSPFVYLSINYRQSDDVLYRTIERWRFDFDLQQLTDQQELFRVSPAGWGHQGGRLLFGPDGMLYATSGDNHTDGWNAQDVNSPTGKILRFNPDGSIPADNPIPGNPLWSLGHRNPQGLAILPNGNIISSEHGNIIEDEVNLIRKGANYGWPGTEGPCDEPYEKPFCDTVDVTEPIYSSGREDTDAFSDLVYYNHDRFPEFQNSLLLTSLKKSTLYQLHMNATQDRVESVTPHFQFAVGRIRDIAVSPDGRIFLCTSNRDPNHYGQFPLVNDDRILEIVYIAEGARPQLVKEEDTVYVVTKEDSTVTFTTNVTNVGNAPTTIIRIDRIIEEGPIGEAHWKKPFVIMPGMTYPIEMRYYPWAPGEDKGHLRLIPNNAPPVDIYIRGTAITSVDEIERTAAPVFPNPFTSRLQITPPSTMSDCTITIVDLLGTTVWRMQSTGGSPITWDGRTAAGIAAAPGTYVLTISDRRSSTSFLIQRLNP